MISKKDAKQEVDRIKSTMAHLIGVPVLISLGPHEFALTIADVQLAATSGLVMSPDKVYNEQTGKYSTPQVLQLTFSTGESINIVMDDLESFTVGVSGAMFKIGKEELKISYDR